MGYERMREWGMGEWRNGYERMKEWGLGKWKNGAWKNEGMENGGMGMGPFFDLAPILSFEGQRTSVEVVAMTFWKKSAALSFSLRPASNTKWNY